MRSDVPNSDLLRLSSLQNGSEPLSTVLIACKCMLDSVMLLFNPHSVFLRCAAFLQGTQASSMFLISAVLNLRPVVCPINVGLSSLHRRLFVCRHGGVIQALL